MSPLPDEMIGLVFVCGIGIFCLFALAIAAAFIFFFVRAGRTAQQLTTLPAEQGEAYLASAALRPWEDAAWVDLSSRWEGWWRNLTRPGRHEGYEHGVIKSLKDPGGDGWIAFTMQRQQIRNAQIVLKTSERRVEINVVGKSISDRNVRAEVTLDGEPAGSIAVTHPNCLYRSADGAVEARWVSEVRWNNERFFGQRLTSRDVSYDDLTVDGRKVAALTDTWIRYPHPESSKPFPPALQSVADGLSRAEQNALLIALGIALYYDALRNRRYIYDW